MQKHRKNFCRHIIFTIGLLIMSLGIVLMIISDFGVSPWDVLHVGLYYQLGLSIGTWSILVGITILGSSAVLMKRWPQYGAYLNMILIGIFIDMFMLLPFLNEPDSLLGKIVMFLIGMILYSYGMGIYLSAKLGAGPRDSFMLAMQEKTGWKVSTVRRIMEIAVLFIGWLLGGPVFVGTLIFSVAIGTFIGFALPQCQLLTDKILDKKIDNHIEKELERGVS
ncbi:YczE/YyaS/YitT family protein [Lederbergia panacisoli]|uniref:YczE/YyaS/YitT family protein n=1 Tax=Lederbergia panacisoli TaxID=1255251 RepID=UPI00214BFA58|nr:YitT family protein [Lederbergia panacisoli]MCR2820498.1 YitT family protein [Lederbergia panacisoli]